MDKELNDFNSLFDLVPSINILFVYDNFDKFIVSLKSDIKKFNGFITQIKIDNLSKEYRQLHQKNFEYAIICDSFGKISNKDSFIKLIHNSIGNSGYIIVLEKKQNNNDFILPLLDKHGFGALSNIDIFKEYDLFMGKKMHMWGMD